MTVQITIRGGRDPLYYLGKMSKQAQAGGGPRVGDRSARGYYLSAVAEGGEPAGIWKGEGLADLGIHDGDAVVGDQFERIYGHWQDTRDPSGETTLGAGPRRAGQVEKAFLALVAKYPEATGEKRRALYHEARMSVKGSGVMYHDHVFAPDKTISLAHASALASAEAAREAGDLRLAAEWDARAAGIWDEIMTSADVYIKHVQATSRVVRTGHHGKADGIDTGRWEDSAELPVAAFAHHTNRQGEPHLHFHLLVLNKVQTERDGVWRSPDARRMYATRGAGSARSAFALESGLTASQGFAWEWQAKSRGRVIAGVGDKVINAFSTRRVAIDKDTLHLAAAYEERHGFEPSPRVLTSLRDQAQRNTRKEKEHRRNLEGVVDHAALLREWEATSRREETGTLTELARSVWKHAPSPERMAARVNEAGELTPAQEIAIMQAGLLDLEKSAATWQRAELVHHIAVHIPDGVVARTQEEAAAKLDELADRALAGGAGYAVVRLDAPEYPRVPDELRRANGDSVFRAPGGEMYATRSQLSLEEQILADAWAHDAASIAPDVCAKLLGASVAQLTQPDADASSLTATGLRMDQAAAAFATLTSPRVAEVVVGPAGTGKSFTAVRMGRAWKAAGLGQVVGLATTSRAREVLAEAGIETTWNTAQFLGHLEGARGALGPKPIGQAPLVILDEATMTSMPDVADILAYVRGLGGKVVPMGDHAQLGSVEAAGALMMLARADGYAQLTDAVRFVSNWEGEASLAIRAGDVSALGTYDDHGRLHGGTREEMTEKAARMYLAEHLAGTDVILTAYTHAECAELSRRVQGYLQDWGHVDQGESIRLRDGAVAYAGDLILARRNEPKIRAAGRKLINSDLLKVEAVGEGHVTVRRSLGFRDGERVWSDAFDVGESYALSDCDLGYAHTWHAVEGSTVDIGISLANDQRPRSGLYPSMTRGRQANYVLAYEAQEECAGQEVGPDPEVGRKKMLAADRDGAAREYAGDSADPVAILARVLRTEDADPSATEARSRSLSGADHLGRLFAIRDDLFRRATAERFSAIVRATVPDEAKVVLADTDDLFRSLRAAELAGLDATDVLGTAASSSLRGARSPGAVLAARVRKGTGDPVPALRESWTEGAPAGYLTELGEVMDHRQERVGQHAAESAALWAVQGLGEVPEEDGAERAQWVRAAGRIGAAREILGWGHSGEPLGPEPGSTSPELRAVWHNAAAVMTRSDGIDVRDLEDGQLLVRRRAYERETAAAPRFVAEELRLARRAELHHGVEAARHRQEAAARRDSALGALHEQMAGSYDAAQARAAEAKQILADAQDTRRQWEVMSEPTRRLAVASDAELHRRGVLAADDRLKSMETAGFEYVQERLDGGGEPADGEEVTEDRETVMARELGITLDYGQAELPIEVREAGEYNRARQEELDERASQVEPSEDPDETDLGLAWATRAQRDRDAVLQPPVPEIPAAEAVLDLAAERDAGAEA